MCVLFNGVVMLLFYYSNFNLPVSSSMLGVLRAWEEGTGEFFFMKNSTFMSAFLSKELFL